MEEHTLSNHVEFFNIATCSKCGPVGVRTYHGIPRCPNDVKAIYEAEKARRKAHQIKKLAHARHQRAKQRKIAFPYTENCNICGIRDSEAGPQHAYDHCHDSEEHRGWLCRACNTGLGMFKDDPVLLCKAAKYLLNFEKSRDYQGKSGNTPPEDSGK